MDRHPSLPERTLRQLASVGSDVLRLWMLDTDLTGSERGLRAQAVRQNMPLTDIAKFFPDAPDDLSGITIQRP